MADTTVIEYPRTTSEDNTLQSLEADEVDKILDLIDETDGLPSIDDIKEYILSKFSANAQTILQDSTQPMYVLFECMCRLIQMDAGLIKKHCAGMLYTQSTGDELSLAAANFGFTRIEAKPSTLNLTITTSKDITLDSGTSFTDGAGTIWLSTASVDITKETPTIVAVQTQDKGAITFISPMSATNNIAGVSSIEADSTSIVVGRDQESDTELKETIAGGSLITGGDDACKRALLQLSAVNSAYVKTNPYDTDMEGLGSVTISPRHRYVSVRTGSTEISQEEADLIAQTCVDNSIYGGIFQPPADGYVQKCFGIEEDMLTESTEDGGAGLSGGISEDSNCILVRITSEYNNFLDVYFNLAEATDIIIEVGIRYSGNYTTTEKENMLGEIKQQITTAVSELAQVGSQLLTSKIINRLLTETDLADKLTIQSMTLRRESEQTPAQYLEADPYEFFQVYSTASNTYAGVEITEE